MSRWRTAPGSTGRLLQLCGGYFGAYVLTGIAVKVFTGGIRTPPLSEIAYLVNNTFGASALCLLVVFAAGWTRLDSERRVRWAGLSIPVEARYIVPSGVCTAAIIPTTTLMYTLPISVMVAMVIMRGSVIVISRLVDAVQIRQGILRRRVFAEENWAVLFALCAVGTHIMLVPLRGGFDFLHSAEAMTILGLYVVAYMLRLYIMNYYKNTRPPGVRQDNRGFFAIEQIAASTTMAVVLVLLALGPRLFGWTDPRVVEVGAALAHPDPAAILSGIPFGLVAFFSVFLFMFEGRTATFAGLVNRLTSLLAGTAATLLLAWLFGMRPPSLPDWVSLAFILVSVAFLTRAERRRTAERHEAPVAASVPRPV